MLRSIFAFVLATITLRKPADAAAVARMILQSCADRRIFTFSGDLGAGKTTLIKGFCEALGVKESTSSPSFSIVNEYRTEDGRTVNHFDLYRIGDPRELEEIGFLEYIDSGDHCFIEWPGIAQDLFPSGTIAIQLSIGPGQHRTIRIEEVR